MKILLQNCRNWRFYRPDRSLTRNPEEAKNFVSRADALAFSRQIGADTQVVMRFSDDEQPWDFDFKEVHRLPSLKKQLRSHSGASFEEPLSRREKEILSCLAAGSSNKEIADSLAVSYETVRSHLKNIYGKLRVRSRIEAVIKHLHHSHSGG